MSSNPPNSRGAEPRLIAGMVLGLALGALGGFMSLRAIAELDAAGGWVTRSIDILNQAQGVENRQLEIEAGSRGYLLTNHPAQLQRLVAARDALPAAFRRVRELIRDPAQLARWQPLEQAIVERVQFSEELVRLHEANPASAVARLQAEGGTDLGARLRRQMQDFEQGEQVLLAARSAELRRDLMRAFVILGISAGSGMLLIAFAGSRILRDSERWQRRLRWRR